MAWGEIGTLPDKPGIAVRFSGHVGVYVGGGEVVEWRGFKHGCVVTDVKKRGWTHWYELPWVEYGEGGAEFDTSTNAPAMVLGNRLLKRGSKGVDVRMLQEALNRLGFDSGEADGDFGPLTEAAVRKMQDAADIETDGKYGEKSHTALMGMLAEIEELPEADPQPAAYDIRVTGGTVNIRRGPGTQYDIITVVRRDQILSATAKAENGWYNVLLDGDTGWISGKYAAEVTADGIN
jgi:peptidoglycan hydrolase-like protein with peptidoglycan-binding domain